jgi:hypothetical protein
VPEPETIWADDLPWWRWWLYRVQVWRYSLLRVDGRSVFVGRRRL